MHPQHHLVVYSMHPYFCILWNVYCTFSHGGIQRWNWSVKTYLLTYLLLNQVVIGQTYRTLCWRASIISGKKENWLHLFTSQVCHGLHDSLYTNSDWHSSHSLVKIAFPKFGNVTRRRRQRVTFLNWRKTIFSNDRWRQLLFTGWPLVWITWKTWKCQGIWNMSGKCQGCC